MCLLMIIICLLTLNWNGSNEILSNLFRKFTNGKHLRLQLIMGRKYELLDYLYK